MKHSQKLIYAYKTRITLEQRHSVIFSAVKMMASLHPKGLEIHQRENNTLYQAVMTSSSVSSRVYSKKETARLVNILDA